MSDQTIKCSEYEKILGYKIFRTRRQIGFLSYDLLHLRKIYDIKFLKKPWYLDSSPWKESTEFRIIPIHQRYNPERLDTYNLKILFDGKEVEYLKSDSKAAKVIHRGCEESISKDSGWEYWRDKMVDTLIKAFGNQLNEKRRSVLKDYKQSKLILAGINSSIKIEDIDEQNHTIEIEYEESIGRLYEFKSEGCIIKWLFGMAPKFDWQVYYFSDCSLYWEFIPLENHQIKYDKFDTFIPLPLLKSAINGVPTSNERGASKDTPCNPPKSKESTYSKINVVKDKDYALKARLNLHISREDTRDVENVNFEHIKIQLVPYNARRAWVFVSLLINIIINTFFFTALLYYSITGISFVNLDYGIRIIPWALVLLLGNRIWFTKFEYPWKYVFYHSLVHFGLGIGLLITYAVLS